MAVGMVEMEMRHGEEREKKEEKERRTTYDDSHRRSEFLRVVLSFFHPPFQMKRRRSLSSSNPLRTHHDGDSHDSGGERPKGYLDRKRGGEEDSQRVKREERMGFRCPLALNGD